MTPDGGIDGRELYAYPNAGGTIYLACKYSAGSNNVTVIARLDAPGPVPPQDGAVPSTAGKYEIQYEGRAPRAQQGDLVFSLNPNGLPPGDYRYDLWFDQGDGEEFQHSMGFSVYKAGGGAAPAGDGAGDGT
jgi:hypothetical protein